MKQEIAVEETSAGTRHSLYVSGAVSHFVDRVSENTGYSKIQIVDYIFGLQSIEKVSKDLKRSAIAIRRPGRQKVSAFKK